jgi:hypothetical protein
LLEYFGDFSEESLRSKTPFNPIVLKYLDLRLDIVISLVNSIIFLPISSLVHFKKNCSRVVSALGDIVIVKDNVEDDEGLSLLVDKLNDSAVV